MLNDRVMDDMRGFAYISSKVELQNNALVVLIFNVEKSDFTRYPLSLGDSRLIQLFLLLLYKFTTDFTCLPESIYQIFNKLPT